MMSELKLRVGMTHEHRAKLSPGLVWGANQQNDAGEKYHPARREAATRSVILWIYLKVKVLDNT
jgi:hypothetical protein